jgi:hypothetical protein
MLDYPIDRETPLVWGMKLLAEILPDVLETDTFYRNVFGSDNELPNLWVKTNNLQVEWYTDDPGRATFSNYEEFSAQDTISLVSWIREEYDLIRDGK